MKKLSSMDVAKRLDDLFLESRPREMIQRIKGEFTVLASDTETYLCFVALFLLALRKAASAGEFRISGGVLTQVTETLEESLVSQLSPFGLSSMDPEAVPKRFQEIREAFFRIWRNTREKAPGPDWYVAKEACFILKRREKDPPSKLIMTFSSLITNYIRSIQNLFKKLEGDGPSTIRGRRV